MVYSILVWFVIYFLVVVFFMFVFTVRDCSDE